LREQRRERRGREYEMETADFGCWVPARPGSPRAFSTCLIACASGRARPLQCKMLFLVRPAGNAGIGRFCRGRPARARELMGAESSGARPARARREPISCSAQACCMRPANQTVGVCIVAAWPSDGLGWDMRETKQPPTLTRLLFHCWTSCPRDGPWACRCMLRFIRCSVLVP
jgi:hypothetical protein